MSYRVKSGKFFHNGKELQIFGINWFGFEQPAHVFHGLWQVNFEQSLDMMKQCGFNALRIPVHPNILKNDTIEHNIEWKNPELQKKRSLEALDYVIAAMEKRGMMYIFDHHSVPTSNQNKRAGEIGEFWYNDFYSDAQWLSDLATLAKRYKGHESFIGIDIKNEPHGRATWGTGNRDTDFNLAAERAFKAIDEVNPDILIFVEGVEGGGSNWGGDLSGMAKTALNIPIDRLVLAPHAYGPSVYQQETFKKPEFPGNLSAMWERQFGFLVAKGYTICPTEMGGLYTDEKATDNGKNHVVGEMIRDKTYLNTYYAWLKSKGIINFFFWCWNANSGDTGGILGINNNQGDFEHVNEVKLKGLKDALYTSKATFLGDNHTPETPKPSDPKPSKHAFKVGDKIHPRMDGRITLTVEGLQTKKDGLYVRTSAVNKQDLFYK